MSLSQSLGWLIGLAYVAAFLWLSWRIARRGGVTVWLFGSRDQRLPALGFRLAFVALLIWPVERSFGATAPLWPLLAAIGAGFALWGQIRMGLSWRIGTASGATGKLVTGGPFRVSRNPVFLGQILLAWALVPPGGWLMLGGAMLMTAAAMVQTRREEAVLRQSAEWRAYAARTPRWLWRL